MNPTVQTTRGSVRGISADGVNVFKGECGWQKFDLGRRATTRFDATPEVVYDPRPSERAIWEGRR